MSLLVLLWVLAVPTASVLGVLALREAEGGSSAAVLSAGEAASLATASPPAGSAGEGAAQPGGTAAPTTSPTPEVGVVTERRVPGAVLGLRCEQATPVLVWSVPDPGWRVDRAEVEDGGLRVRLESDEDEVRVTVVCRDGEPEVVGATREDD